jgi:regulator of sigma E protease
MNSGAPRDPLTIGTLPSLPADAITLQEGDVVLKIAGLDAPAPSTASLFTFANDLPRTSLLPYEVERAGAVMIVDGPFPTLARVGGVTPQSAAIAAGLKEGDVIVGVNGDPIVAFAELKTAVESSDGASVALSVWRDGETFDTELTPKRVDEPQPEGGFVTSWRIGIISSYAFDPATESIGVGTAISAGASQVWRIIEGSVSGLKHMIVGDISTCNLSGPIGIAQTSGAMASQGIDSFIWFIAVLSTAVGFLNLFPIPALDGGHLVFYAYEAVTGKPPNDGWLRVLMTFGLIMVLSLMVFALGNDIFCP